MKTSGNFILVTLNCIAAAIAAGLATAVMLMFVVLLINGRSAAIDMKETPAACHNGEPGCIVLQHESSTGNDASI